MNLQPFSLIIGSILAVSLATSATAVVFFVKCVRLWSNEPSALLTMLFGEKLAGKTIVFSPQSHTPEASIVEGIADAPIASELDEFLSGTSDCDLETTALAYLGSEIRRLGRYPTAAEIGAAADRACDLAECLCKSEELVRAASEGGAP